MASLVRETDNYCATHDDKRVVPLATMDPNIRADSNTNSRNRDGSSFFSHSPFCKFSIFLDDFFTPTQNLPRYYYWGMYKYSYYLYRPRRLFYFFKSKIVVFLKADRRVNHVRTSNL